MTKVACHASKLPAPLRIMCRHFKLSSLPSSFRKLIVSNVSSPLERFPTLATIPTASDIPISQAGVNQIVQKCNLLRLFGDQALQREMSCGSVVALCACWVGLHLRKDTIAFVAPLRCSNVILCEDDDHKCQACKGRRQIELPSGRSS